MSAKKWRQLQQEQESTVQHILDKDIVYIDNMRAAREARAAGRITANTFALITDTLKDLALRRYELKEKGLLK